MTNASITNLDCVLHIKYWDLIRVVDALIEKANAEESEERVYSAKDHRQIAHDILLSLSQDMPDATWRMDDLVKKLGNE